MTCAFAVNVTVLEASAAEPTKTMRPSKPATEPLGMAPISRCAVPRRGPGPAQVATRSALSIRKSACTCHQSIHYLCAIHAGHTHTLRPRSFTADDDDVTLGKMEVSREEGDELVIRRAVDGRGGEADQQRAAASAGQR